MPKTLVIGIDEDLVEGLNGEFSGDPTASVDIVEEATFEAIAGADVIVFDASNDIDDVLDVASRVSDESPGTGMVIIADDLDATMLRCAMRSGIRDVLAVDEVASEVARAVRSAYAASSRMRAEVPPVPIEEAAQGKVVTVFSTKGGVGKTVVATNLGVALAKAGRRTILLDLDLQFGDTGIMLQLKPVRTIFDAMQQYDRLDEDMLKGFLTEHSSGLDVLLAPVHPEDADSITASRVGRIIGLLQDMADMVVIDTPGAFNDVVLAALDRSDEVYAIATMDVASIKNTRISLQKLAQLGYDDDRIRIVLNRADSKVWIEAGEVESAVEAEIVAKIPSDRLVPRSVNKGVPVVSDSPKSAVAKSLEGLAEMIGRNGEVKTHVTEG